MNDVVAIKPIDGVGMQPTAQALLSLARARVHARLRRAIDFPILVLSAPAGYGKSTVLREFLDVTGRTHRRLRILPKHGDLLSFMRALATRLDDVAPALLTSYLGVYDRMNRAEDAPAMIAQWAADHLRWVDVCVTIDGLENVADERLYALLTELVDQTAQTRLRWIIVTRSATAFPTARWLADDRMDLAIDEVDLALTYEDLEAAVASSGASISPARLRAVCTSAANWPAAVALLLGTIVDFPQKGTVSSGRRPYAYFANHAFMARSGVEQQFLLESCLYQSFDPALLARAGWLNVDAMLAQLRSAGAFFYAEPDGSNCYHELFRRFLEERLRASAGDIFTRIATRTADVCRTAGRWSDALELYTELGAAGAIGKLLSDHGFEIMDRGETDLVSQGLGLLGDPEYSTYPVALALKASLESLHGSFDVAESWFRHAIENVDEPQAHGAIVFRFATDLVRRDRRDAIDLLQPIVEAGGYDLGLAVSLGGLLATAYATHHMDAEAASTIEHALQQLADVEDTAIRAKLYYQAGYVALFARDWQRAKRFAQRALETALASHLYDIAARTLSILYNVAMDYEDDIVATRQYLELLASCSINAGSRHLLLYATLGRYEIEVLGGNLVESARLDETLKSLEIDYSVIATETLLPAQALRATWSGDFHRAFLLVAPTAEKQITPIRRAQRFSEIAVYAAAAGLRGEAIAAAKRAITTVAKCTPTDKAVAFTRAYVALALTLLGRRRRALHLLDALHRSPSITPRVEELVGAIRAINERWARGRYATGLQSALDRLTDRDLGGIARLIEALPLPQTFRGQLEDLSGDERELLAQLCAGRDAHDLAARCGQSSESVEEQILLLCRKLGCASARHAVALARSANVSRTGGLHGH